MKTTIKTFVDIVSIISMAIALIAVVGFIGIFIGETNAAPYEEKLVASEWVYDELTNEVYHRTRVKYEQNMDGTITKAVLSSIDDFGNNIFGIDLQLAEGLH